MPNFQVDFYKKADGSIPVKEFLDSLEKNEMGGGNNI